VVYVFGKFVLGGWEVSGKSIQAGRVVRVDWGGRAEGQNKAAQEAYLDLGLLLIFTAEEPADAVHDDVRNRRGEFMGLP
jgi:hypothetical protein